MASVELMATKQVARRPIDRLKPQRGNPVERARLHAPAKAGRRVFRQLYPQRVADRNGCRASVPVRADNNFSHRT